MRFIKSLGVLIKYIPFIVILLVFAFLLYRDATTVVDKTQSAILVWKNVIAINTIFSLLCSMIVQDKYIQLTKGKASNIVDDFEEKDSGDFSLSYGWVICDAICLGFLSVLIYLYSVTTLRIYMFLAHAFALILALSTVINILALYLQAKQEETKSVMSKLLNPIILPSIICLFLFLITNESTVGFVYSNLQIPQNTVSLILALIVVLCYLPVMLFCHFSNLYCLTAFAFVKKDLTKIQAKINAVQEKNTDRMEKLIKITKYVDKTAEQASFFKKIGLAICFICSHVKAYFNERVCAVSYLLYFVKLKITRVFGGLLLEDKLQINTIRFCEIVVVLELLILDMLLFIYLGSEDPCSRFFELLSTVIIIPILLSSLANMKTKK